MEDGLLTAPFVLEYRYRRTVGPIIGAFLTGLRDGKILAAKTARGPVICPPQEYDPHTGEDILDLVDVPPTGTVKSFAIVHKPLASHPRQTPFAFVLVQLDGADTAMTHIFEASDLHRLATGARVRAVFAEQRVGFITDIRHFTFEDAQ